MGVIWHRHIRLEQVQYAPEHVTTSISPLPFIGIIYVSLITCSLTFAFVAHSLPVTVITADAQKQIALR